MRTAFAVAACCVWLARAQSTSSVSGVVRDATTGKPLANYVVFTYDATNDATSTTDEQGRYRLSGLAPKSYRIQARDAQRFGSQATRNVTVAGSDVEGIDINIRLDGTITGKVVDENKEPVPGMWVFLVSREYFLGAMGYFFKQGTQTNDRGEYTFSRVDPGHPYLLMAERLDLKLPAHSVVPVNPKLRRPVPVRTWYPNSPLKEGAQGVTLSPGERRQSMDIEVKKLPSYCAEGTLRTPFGPAALRFSIEALQPSSGISSTGGMYVGPSSGTTGPDGKFRICDLPPGSYRLTAVDTALDFSRQPSNFAVETISIVDRDLRNLEIATSGGMPPQGEVVWDGAPPATPVTAPVTLQLEPLLRTRLFGDEGHARSTIPGTFSFVVFPDDYAVHVFLNAPGLYVKDVTYSGRSVLYEAFRPGNAAGDASLRIIVGGDGAKFHARVTDKDGNPAPDIHVLAMPAEVTSEGMLAATLITGATDQLGQYASRTLAPGKYYVVSTPDSFDATPESIDRLWRSRDHFQEVELPTKGTAELNLQPVKID